MECDIQKVFAKHIFKYPQVAHNAKRFSEVSQLLQIPTVATRHVKKNFKEIDDIIPEHPGRVIFDKS